MGDKMNLIPIKGKEYHAYDDGKITFSRHYIVNVSNVYNHMYFRKHFKDIYDIWVKDKKNHYWIFKDTTDYFVETTNPYDNFDKEYFYSVFFEGKDDYYSDYLDRKKQSESLQGKSNLQEFRKVLRTAGSSLYEDQEEQEVKEKNANIQIAFNPLLIGLSLTILSILSTPLCK